MKGIREDDIVKEMVHDQVKRRLNLIASAHSKVLNERKEKLKSFDPPKSFQILKRHERRYIEKN